MNNIIKNYALFREEIEPIGDGPVFNPKGHADVSSSLIGSYSITTDDFRRNATDPKELNKNRINTVA